MVLSTYNPTLGLLNYFSWNFKILRQFFGWESWVNSKNTHIFVSAFKTFAESGYEDAEFGKFLNWFVNGGSETEIDGKAWEVWDANKATRDSGTVHGKIDYLETLMKQYFKEISKAA